MQIRRNCPFLVFQWSQSRRLRHFEFPDKHFVTIRTTRSPNTHYSHGLIEGMNMGARGARVGLSVFEDDLLINISYL